MLVSRGECGERFDLSEWQEWDGMGMNALPSIVLLYCPSFAIMLVEWDFSPPPPPSPPFSTHRQKGRSSGLHDCSPPLLCLLTARLRLRRRRYTLHATRYMETPPADSCTRAEHKSPLHYFNPCLGVWRWDTPAHPPLPVDGKSLLKLRLLVASAGHLSLLGGGDSLSVFLLAHGQIVEPGVLQGVCGGDAHLGAELEHAVEEVEADLVDLGQDQAEILGGVDGEVALVLWELGDAGPRALRGRAHQAEDLLQLVLVGGAGEQRAARVHLGHDAAGGPDVDAGVVGAAAEQDVRGAVPQGDDLVGEGVDGDAKGAGEAKVGELELAARVDEQVLGLEVAVQDAVVVAEGDAAHQLVHEGLDGGGVEGASIAARVHVALQVLVHELEDEHELVLGVNDVVQQDNVLVAQLLHERDLADGRRGRALLRVEVDLLEGDQLARLAVAALEDGGIGALAQLLQLLEAAGVASRVHVLLCGRRLAVAKIAHGNGRLSAKGDSEDGLEAAARGAVGVLPELGARSRDLAGDVEERRRRRERGRAVAGGGWRRRGGCVVRVRVGRSAGVDLVCELWAGWAGLEWRGTKGGDQRVGGDSHRESLALRWVTATTAPTLSSEADSTQPSTTQIYLYKCEQRIETRRLPQCMIECRRYIQYRPVKTLNTTTPPMHTATIPHNTTDTTDSTTSTNPKQTHSAVFSVQPCLLPLYNNCNYNCTTSSPRATRA